MPFCYEKVSSAITDGWDIQFRVGLIGVSYGRRVFCEDETLVTLIRRGPMAAANAAGILIKPVTRPVQGTVRPPGSKSLTNRALVVAALAEGNSELLGVLDSVDTRVMIDSL